MLMPFTEEFTTVLKNCRRKYNNIDAAFSKAMEEAQDKGIDTYRERAERNSRIKWKQQKNATFPYLDI